MPEMYNGHELTDLEQAEVDVNDILDELDSCVLHGDRDGALLLLDEGAARAYDNKDFFDIVRAMAENTENADPADFEHGDVGKQHELNRLHAMTERPPVFEHFEAPKPEDLPNWEAAATSVARVVMTANRQKAQIYHQGSVQRAKTVDTYVDRMEKAIADDPSLMDLSNTDEQAVQFRAMYAQYTAGQDELQRQAAELTPEAELNRVVDRLSVAIEANQVPPNVLNRYLTAHLDSQTAAQVNLDKYTVTQGNLEARITELKNAGHELSGDMAEVTLVHNRSQTQRETGESLLAAEDQKVANITYAINRLNPNIIREKYEARLHESTLGVKERAFAAVEAYRNGTGSEHEAHVAIQDMQTQADFFANALKAMKTDKRGDPRTVMPPEYAVTHRMLGEAQSALFALHLQKRVHDFEQADGGTNFRGRPPIGRTPDGGYRIRTNTHTIIMYPDRSFRQGTTTSGLSERLNADGSEWQEGQITPDMLEDRSRCQQYLRTTSDPMSVRAQTLRGYWLANQSDPVISQLAARLTGERLRQATAAYGGDPRYAAALNTLRYQYHQYRGEGQYDRSGRGVLTVHETRPGARPEDPNQTWEVTITPRGRRTERRL